MSKATSFNFTEGDSTPFRDEVFAPETETGPPASACSVDYTDLGIINEPLEKNESVFVERSEYINDEYEYERSGSDPGLVVIFNQQKFDAQNLETRIGTNRDVNELILTFGRLGYNMDREYIYEDRTRKEILTILEEISKLDHSKRNSLIIAVLTHGDSGNALQAKDELIHTKEIWKPFSAHNCPGLANKPKFFIFQACKGKRFSQHDSTEVEIIPRAFYTTPWEPDMLVAFAAVEGSQSYRHMFNGTWFIQEMCRNFLAFGRRDDVVSLLIRTTKCVANNYYHITQDKNHREEGSSVRIIKKQMPLFVSTLRKKFYLSRSKDRNLLLRLLQQQQEIVETLKDVQEKVNVMYDNYQVLRRPKQK